jgi:hydrogenase nickel incorporation protein HypB
MCDEHVHLDLKQRVLAANENVAARLRQKFRDSGTLVLNLISSPGSGKTTLLEATIRALGNRLRLGAVEGDVATERDAERIRKLGVPARQILTGGACHLDARQIHHEMDHWADESFDILFVENVGNLVCPATYDLGEDFKVVLLSVTEGDDKPFKYPAIFSRAAVTVITKSDLLPHLTFDLDQVRQQVASLRPDAPMLVTSAKTGDGIPAWCDLLLQRLEEKRRPAAGPAAKGEPASASGAAAGRGGTGS